MDLHLPMVSLQRRLVSTASYEIKIDKEGTKKICNNIHDFSYFQSKVFYSTKSQNRDILRTKILKTLKRNTVLLFSLKS